MARSRSQEVRRNQKKSFYLRELSSFLSRLAIDEPGLAGLYITRVDLSPDGGKCYIYFSFYDDQSAEQKLARYEQVRKTLVLYKGSLRKQLSQSMHSRYVPHLQFMFDDKKEQEHRVDELLTKVGKELAEADAREQDESLSDEE